MTEKEFIDFVIYLDNDAKEKRDFLEMMENLSVISEEQRVLMGHEISAQFERVISGHISAYKFGEDKGA